MATESNSTVEIETDIAKWMLWAERAMVQPEAGIPQCYIVMGTSGEYSDRTEWVWRVYLSKQQAEGEVVRLELLARAAGVHASTDVVDIDARAEFTEGMRGNYISYTGVRWHVVQADLMAPPL